MNRTGTLIFLATAMLAGCGTTSSLGSAADRLDSSARRFYEVVETDRAPGHATNDAAMLAEATRDFSRAAGQSRSRDELRPSFDRVAERYHHLRRLVDEPDSRYGNGSVAFDHVTEAYLDVDRAMNHPDSRYHD
jgi:hypothetical protein